MPFYLAEFFDLISVCDKNSDLIKNKTILLLLGTTGCGKSTTTQYLFGAPMKKGKGGHIEASPMPKELEALKSNSAAMRSATRYTTPY